MVSSKVCSLVGQLWPQRGKQTIAFNSCHVDSWSFLVISSSASSPSCGLEGWRTWPNLRGNGTFLPPFTDLVNCEFFKQFRPLAVYQICFIFLTGKQNFIFPATSRRSPKKWVKFIFERIFSSKQIVFFAAFIMKFRQSLTPYNLCIPSPLSIHMVIRYLWCLPEASQSHFEAVLVGSASHCIAATD